MIIISFAQPELKFYSYVLTLTSRSHIHSIFCPPLHYLVKNTDVNKDIIERIHLSLVHSLSCLLVLSFLPYFPLCCPILFLFFYFLFLPESPLSSFLRDQRTQVQDVTIHLTSNTRLSKITASTFHDSTGRSTPVTTHLWSHLSTSSSNILQSLQPYSFSPQQQS